LLKELTGLPWVADFRDSWIYDPLDPVLGEYPYRRAFEARLEEAVIRGADAVVVATEAVAEHLRPAYPDAAARIRIVTNGFEPADFARSAPPPARDPLRLVHTGSFSLSHPQRTPQPLFAALEAMLAADRDWARRVHLELVGPLSLDEERAAAGLAEAGVVHLAGPQTRAEALTRQQAAHVLLLVDHVRDWASTNVPGKFYEYLAVQRPVLALGSEGMVERLVRELGVGLFVRADDPAAIRAALEELYARFSRGALGARVDPKILCRYHRRELTRELASIFDQLVER
jgi:glycosyltransferase involved in cell wall biosynthesis